MKGVRRLLPMEPAAFRERVVLILGNPVEFLGAGFDDIVRSLTPGVEERLFSWLERVAARKEKGMAPDAGYRGYAWHQLLIFRFPFSLESGRHRVLVVKVKNARYVEFHLGGHQYYDEVRSRLGV